MKQNKDKNLSAGVMDKIHQDEVKMKPRLHFIIGSLLLALGLVINVFLAILFFTICVFRLRIFGPVGYLGFGQSGLRPFVATFPWLFLLLGILAIIGGIFFLRKYDFSYKKNFLMIIVWLVVLVTGAGFLLDQVGFNDRAELMNAIKPLYRTQYAGQNWLVGEIVDIQKDEVTVLTPEGQTISVQYGKETKLPAGQDFILGDKIKVVGELEETDQFQAEGIDQLGRAWKKSLYMEVINFKRPCPRCYKASPLKSDK